MERGKKYEALVSDSIRILFFFFKEKGETGKTRRDSIQTTLPNIKHGLMGKTLTKEFLSHSYKLRSMER